MVSPQQIVFNMSSVQKLPVIEIPNSVADLPDSNFKAHISDHSYIAALLKHSKCIAFQIPSLGKNYNYSDLINYFDGILLTSRHANIEPRYYGGYPFLEGEVVDHAARQRMLNR